MNKKDIATKTGARGTLAVAICCLGVTLQAGALEYYTWVDERGVTHLSEEPPVDGRGQRVQVEVPSPASRSQDADADYYSIANQNQRMQARRREREQYLAERELEQERLRLQREELASRAYDSDVVSQTSTGWRRDPGTEYAEYQLIDSGYGYRSRSHGRRHGENRRDRRDHRQHDRYRNHRRHGGHARGNSGRTVSRSVGVSVNRSRSIGVTRPARPVGPGSRF